MEVAWISGPKRCYRHVRRCRRRRRDCEDEEDIHDPHKLEYRNGCVHVHRTAGTELDLGDCRGGECERKKSEGRTRTRASAADSEIRTRRFSATSGSSERLDQRREIDVFQGRLGRRKAVAGIGIRQDVNDGDASHQSRRDDREFAAIVLEFTLADSLAPDTPLSAAVRSAGAPEPTIRPSQ